MAHRCGSPGVSGALDVAGSRPITQPRPFGAQLGREMTVVTHLVEEGEHRGVQGAVGHGVLVELAHRGQEMVDPPRRADLALPSPGTRGRCRLQHGHEQPERLDSGEQVPSGGFAPRQEARQITGVGAGGALGPVGSEPEVTQVGVSDLDWPLIVVGHGFTMLVFEQPDVYGIDDLRADVNRLISNLNEAKFAS